MSGALGGGGKKITPPPPPPPPAIPTVSEEAGERARKRRPRGRRETFLTGDLIPVFDIEKKQGLA